MNCATCGQEIACTAAGSGATAVCLECFAKESKRLGWVPVALIVLAAAVGLWLEGISPRWVDHRCAQLSDAKAQGEGIDLYNKATPNPPKAAVSPGMRPSDAAWYAENCQDGKGR